MKLFCLFRERERLREIESRKHELEEELEKERMHLEELQRLEAELKATSGRTPPSPPPPPELV